MRKATDPGTHMIAPAAAPMGVFQDSTARDRLRFAVFAHDHATQGVPTLCSLTPTL
jgi:hypothetical protein